MYQFTILHLHDGDLCIRWICQGNMWESVSTHPPTSSPGSCLAWRARDHKTLAKLGCGWSDPWLVDTFCLGTRINSLPMDIKITRWSRMSSTNPSDNPWISWSLYNSLMWIFICHSSFNWSVNRQSVIVAHFAIFAITVKLLPNLVKKLIFLSKEIRSKVPTQNLFYPDKRSWTKCENTNELLNNSRLHLVLSTSLAAFRNLVQERLLVLEIVHTRQF